MSRYPGKHIRAAAVALLILGVLIMLAAPSYSGDPKEGSACGFCVCPPGPVSDKIEVELRLGIKNQSSEDHTYDISFYLDRMEKDAIIHQEKVDVKAKSSRLVSHWWPTAGHIGKPNLLYKVESGGKLVDEGSWTLEVYPSDTTSLPWATGMWFDPGSWKSEPKLTPEDVRVMMDCMHRLGMSTVIVTYSESVCFGGGPYYPSSIPEFNKQMVDFDFLQIVFDQAEKNGQHVVLGLGRGTDYMLCWGGCEDPERVAKQLDLAKRHAKELWDRYGKSPALYGWYLGHEADDIPASNAFYNPITDYLHDFAPEKVVMIAPSGAPIVTPAIVSDCHYDAIAYQDAVGSGYVPYVNTFDPEKRIDMLRDIYGAYRAAHYGARKHYWTDLEIWEMAGPEYNNGYAAPFSRVLRQIDIEKHYCQMITFYNFAMVSPPGLKVAFDDERAKKLYLEYEKYYERELEKARKKAARLIQDRK